MGQRKCAAAFLLAEEMYQIPATKSVILARDLVEGALYLRAARQWGEVMFEHTQCTEYIVEQRERCIRLSNSRHEDRIRQHEQASDLQYIHKHINDVYTRMGLKDDGVFNTA